MTATRYTRRSLITIAATILPLTALGCGLGDYEKHMDDELAYLKEFDEENKALGGALELPKKTVELNKAPMQAEALSVKFFLRPPVWIALKSRDGESFASGKVALYRYPGPTGYNLLITTAELDKNPQNQIEIKGGMAPSDFRAQVRGALAQFVQKEYRLTMNVSAGDDKLTRVHFPVRNLHGRPGNLEFDKQEFTDNEAAKNRAFEVYYRVDGLIQAAVIYELPPPMAQDQAARKTIDLSLRTLVLGQDALAKIQELVSRSRRPQTGGKAKIINSNDLK